MGVDDWTEVKRKNRGFISKEDDLAKGRCNLCTLWIGKLRLHANTTRFQRPPVKPIISAPVRENVKNSQTHSGKRQNQERVPFPKQSNFGGSYANVVKDYNSQISNSAPIVKSPTVVLDEDCYIPRDLSLHVMGKVKDASSITRLQNTLLKEGFPDVHLSFLGGLWEVLNLLLVKIYQTQSVIQMIEDSYDGNSVVIAFKQSYASAKDVHSISDKKKVSSPKCNSKVFNIPLENSKDDKPSNEDSFIVSNKKGNGGFILDALDDMIRIGQSMGYDMEGCSQDIERIIGLQGGNVGFNLLFFLEYQWPRQKDEKGVLLKM
ncbi:hypothetical protein Tco_1313538 [Tanacetum coccineum]